MRVVQKTRRVQYVEVQDGLMNPKDKYVTKRRSYNELNTKGYFPFVGTDMNTKSEYSLFYSFALDSGNRQVFVYI